MLLILYHDKDTERDTKWERQRESSGIDRDRQPDAHKQFIILFQVHTLQFYVCAWRGGGAGNYVLTQDNYRIYVRHMIQLPDLPVAKDI